MEVSGKSSLNDSLDYFCQTGGQEVVDIWDLNESLIPLSHGVFQKWRKDQDALPLLHSIPFLISLFIACGKPKVAEVVILQLNTLMYWMEQRKDLMMTMGLNTQMLDDIWIELHNARDTHYFNDKGEATVAAFEKITSLLKLRYMTRDTRAAELGINRKRQEAEVQLLVAKYEKSGWSPTKSKYKSWLLRHVRAAAEKAKGIINGTDPKPAVLRHRLLSKGSEGLLSSLEGTVAHCKKFQDFGGWHAAGSAQEVADAAVALGVDVGECKNRDEVAEKLLEAGWTYFEYYIFQEELSKGRVPTFG